MTALPHGIPPCLEAALDYAGRGWRVFPVQPSTKKPFGGTRGLLEATTDEATIRRWWMRWPAANVAIATGNGLAVVDEDTYKGGDAGPLSLPPTLTATTPRGGKHMLYSMPEEIRAEHTGKLGKFVDFQGDGAYIVAPPSRTPDGQYAWVNDMSVQPLPSNVLRTLTRKSEKAPAPKPLPTPRRDESDGMYWLDKAVSRARGEGRNNAGLWLACQLRDNQCSDPEGAMLAYAAEVRDWEAPYYTDGEAMATLRGVLRGGPREPARSQSRPNEPTPIRQSANRAHDIPKTIPQTDGANALDGSEDDEQEPRFRFRIDTEVQRMPKPEWLIDKHLVANRLSVVFGEYGSAKSFLTLDWAFCIATGLPWQGKTVQRGPVAYVAGEGIGGMGPRITAWKQQHDWPEESPAGVWMLGEPAQLLAPRDVIDLRAAIAGLPEIPVLVVIDTLARSMAGGDENSAQDMGIAVAAAETIRKEFGCHVLIVHHKPTGAAKTRGSSALPGAADTLIDVTKDGDLITVSCAKQKDAAAFEKLNLTLLVKALSEHPDDTSCVLISTERRGQERPLPKSAQEVLRYLTELPAHRARFAEVQHYMEENYGTAKSTVAKSLETLEERQQVYKRDGFWTLVETGY